MVDNVVDLPAGKRTINLARVIKELNVLPEYQRQICLQGTEEDDDPFLGCGRRHGKFKEEELIVPLFDIPYTNSIIKKFGLYRTRVLRLFPHQCYTYHKDPTKRIHIPLISNKKCFMIVGKKGICILFVGFCIRETTTDNIITNFWWYYWSWNRS